MKSCINSRILYFLVNDYPQKYLPPLKPTNIAFDIIQVAFF